MDDTDSLWAEDEPRATLLCQCNRLTCLGPELALIGIQAQYQVNNSSVRLNLVRFLREPILARRFGRFYVVPI